MKTLALLSLLCIFSCAQIGTEKRPEKPKPVAARFKMAKPQFFFGFGNHHYSYCPQALIQSDGSTEVWFCGNPNNSEIVDNIFHVTEGKDGKNSKAVSVLQPSFDWDSHHTCDPSVVEGEFLYAGTTYRYAMFYTANRLDYFYNEIGVAFSNDLKATSWVKFPTQVVEKTWAGVTEQDLGASKSWGVGQPSAFSLDRKGKVCLTYTIGDRDGSRTVWRDCDFSDMSNIVLGPVHEITRNGLKTLNNTQENFVGGADFAVDEKNDKILLFRPVSPTPATCPTYIHSASEIDYMSYSDFRNGKGQWTKMYTIGKDASGFARVHNPCIARDNFGYVENWEDITFYYTVAKEEPEVYLEWNHMPEWSYVIYKSRLYKDK